MDGKKARRWNEVDFLYTIGIVLVLIGHSHSSDWSQFENTVLLNVIRFIYTFHMPLFFFIAGFLFQNSGRLENDGLKKWIKDKFIRLLIPYFFWSLIALVPKYYLENRSIAGLGVAVINLAINPRAGVWGHFWFLPVIFLTYAIFGVGRSLIKNEKCLVYGSFAVSMIIYFLPVTTSVLGLADLRSSLVFFAVGTIANRLRSLLDKMREGHHWKSFLSCVFLTLVCVLLTDPSYQNRAVGLLVAILMIAACWLAATMVKRGRITAWVSSHNFTLYIFSWFFQATMMAVCGKMNLGWISTFFLMFSAGAIGPTMVILIYEKTTLLQRSVIKLIIGAR